MWVAEEGGNEPGPRLAEGDAMLVKGSGLPLLQDQRGGRQGCSSEQELERQQGVGPCEIWWALGRTTVLFWWRVENREVAGSTLRFSFYRESDCPSLLMLVRSETSSPARGPVNDGAETCLTPGLCASQCVMRPPPWRQNWGLSEGLPHPSVPPRHCGSPRVPEHHRTACQTGSGLPGRRGPHHHGSTRAPAAKLLLSPGM